ncbi:hypothetical protein M9434_001527 [Picochlorum sp. BPE23]|nr:hypothetical protein M9434_001527 [Picochlorum sp. BPE23]
MNDQLRTGAVDVDIVLHCLPPSIRDKLKDAGFRSDSDLVGIQPLELASEANMTHEDALLVLKSLSTRDSDALRTAQSARDIYEREQRSKCIVTFSMDLDRVLGGGIRTGQMTEFCGAPGIGKTQIGMQLAVNVQVPLSFNGLEGEAVYIDTEGSFAPQRCLAMATAFCKHLEKVAVARNDAVRISDAQKLDPLGILERIHYFRVRDSTEQLAVVETLQSFIASHPKVKVIIIDSIAFHFRQDFDDMSLRTRRLSQMAQTLMSIAHTHDIAIVLMNHVTTKILGEGKSRIVPALGDSWAHAATNRLICYWKDRKRYAFLFKSPHLPAAAAEFRISKDGVRTAKTSQPGTKRPYEESKPS